MSQSVDSPPNLTSRTSMSWAEAWLTALLRPSLQNYEKLANEPDASLNRVYVWVSTAAFLTGLSSRIISEESGSWIEISGQDLGLSAVYLWALMTVALFMTIVFITNLLAKIMKGQGTLTQLAYTCAAFYAPITLFETIGSLVPGDTVSSLSLILCSIYLSVLTVIAVRAVHQVGIGKALFASFPVIALNASFVFLGVVALTLDSFM